MDLTQVNFESLQQIARRFEFESAELNHLYLKTYRMVDSLIESSWAGQGADRFYDEMYEIVLPALDRVGQALAEASLQTNQVASIYQQAQEQAANQLHSIRSADLT